MKAEYNFDLISIHKKKAQMPDRESVLIHQLFHPFLSS